MQDKCNNWGCYHWQVYFWKNKGQKEEIRLVTNFHRPKQMCNKNFIKMCLTKVRRNNHLTNIRLTTMRWTNHIDDSLSLRQIHILTDIL